MGFSSTMHFGHLLLAFSNELKYRTLATISGTPAAKILRAIILV